MATPIVGATRILVAWLPFRGIVTAMQIEQVTVAPSPPFPIYPDPARELLRAHATTCQRLHAPDEGRRAAEVRMNYRRVLVIDLEAGAGAAIDAVRRQDHELVQGEICDCK